MKGIGLLKIPGGILCKKDALGQTFSVRVAGVSATISFPSLADNVENENCVGMSNRLEAPTNGAELTLGGEKIFWGFPMTAPGMNSFVEYVLMEVDCDDTESHRIAQKLYSGVQDWTRSFKCFLQLLTKQQLERNRNASNPGNNLQLLFNGKYVENKQPQVLYVQLHADSDFASHEQIKQAIDYASSGKELFLEYQMLLSAYDARKQGENRQAIIDACSAVEICLVNWISCYCNQKGIAPGVLTDKYKSLGDHFNLIKKLDRSFPSLDFGNVIVKPRNDVAHNRDTFPANECTDKLIEMVEIYLANYHTSYY